MIKVTFTLDEESVEYLERMSRRLGQPKSQLVREAIQAYGEQLSRLSDEERDRMLTAFDELTPRIPERPREDVDAELAEIRAARRSGGRRAAGSGGA